MSRMRSSSVPALALICAMALAMACTALAQNSPQDYVNAHNSARAAVGVGPVSWDSNVAAYAESYAKQRMGDCQLKHSGGPYGENLFGGSGRNYTAADAVNLWVSEKQYYDYNSNTCATGQVCGHYTQVVWRSSTAIGCARVRCNRGAIFIICNYNPPGNYVGQRPYENNDYDGPQPPYQQKILTNWGWIETRILTNCAMALAMACTALAQNSPQDYVNAHNSARAAVGVGPVSWDATVAAYAQNYANQRIADCQLVHSGGPYGENIFWGSGRDFTAADAVNSWVSEKQYYDYNSNTCAAGKVCGHYTQVVWRSSTAIGCARVRCNSGAIFIICNYNPPGNYIGQRPY